MQLQFDGRMDIWAKAVHPQYGPAPATLAWCTCVCVSLQLVY